MIILDASLMIEWLLGAERRTIAYDLYEALPGETILVPSHWPVEIGNALRSHLRSAKLPAEKVHELIDQLDEFDIQMEPPIRLDEIGPLAHFAMVYGLTAYDAVYVQLALQRKGPLATLDNAMRHAAQRLNIPLVPA